MRAEGCREWRESMGAYALGHLAGEEKASLEAHLEGCPECRAEIESLALVTGLLPHGDPESFDPAPAPPAALGERIAEQVGAERRATMRRRRLRRCLALGGVTAAAAALAIFAFPDGGDEAPAQHVSFGSLPPGLEINARLEPRAFGTEVHVYVKGAPSGALCRVFLRSPDGTRSSAGSFRYRWGDDSQVVLSSALDLARANAIGVRVGNRIFMAPVGAGNTTSTGGQAQKETST